MIKKSNFLMLNIVDSLNRQILDSKIDIETLNELIQYEENGNKFTINEKGEIICEKIVSPWYSKIFSKIKDLIIKILKIISSLNEKEENQINGIINISNNCYLNAGLQILSRCYPLFIELLNSNYEKDPLIKLFVESITSILFKKDKFYNPKDFIEYFCERNKDFIFGKQNCSQDFIRTLLRNINETLEKKMRYEYYVPGNDQEKRAYILYINENKIFPESKAHSIFSGILKINLIGKCSCCGAIINDYSFSSFVDQQIYLDSFKTKCKFIDVLKKNIGENKAIIKCPKCKQKQDIKSFSKFVKIPEILIFTLERYLVRNKVPIEPDEFIDMQYFVDESCDVDKNDCLYELFAINIRLGQDISFGHEICQVKQKNIWYTINDGDSYLKQRDFNEYSYGLFYRRIHIKDK